MSARPSTYTWANVLDIIRRKIPAATDRDLQVHIVNNTMNYVWDKYDWRESLASLPPFYLVPNEQDYGAPAVVIPQDFYGLRWCNLMRASNVPPYRQPLAIIKDLQPTHIRYLPHAICYVSDKKAFRLYPRIPDNIGSPDYLVEGQYKTRPAKINVNTIASTYLPFDDIYFDMWIETAKWVAWEMDSDPRAGQITWQNGQMTATGQAAVMMASIEWVASREGLELGDPVISPSEPLVSQGPYRPQMFGVGFGF
jgi:hypothetical protein